MRGWPTSPSERELRAELAEANRQLDLAHAHIGRLVVVLDMAVTEALAAPSLPPGFREWLTVAVASLRTYEAE